MATAFLVDLILSGHEVFLLEDEETNGGGRGFGASAGLGWGRCSGSGFGSGRFNSIGSGNSAGNGTGDGNGGGYSTPQETSVEKENKYGYRLPG